MDQYIGSFIGAGFGLGWAVGGCLGLSGRPRVFGITLSALFTLLLSIALWNAHTHATGANQAAPGDWNVYGVAVVLEVIAIVVSVRILAHRGLSDRIMPVIGIIVGLHFIGLWIATHQPVFPFVTAGMVAACAAAFQFKGSARTVVTGLGCAAVLWLSAASTLVRN
jgi:hypothetical protein